MWKQQVALRNALGDPWPTMVATAHGGLEDRMTLVEAMAEAQRLGSQSMKTQEAHREIIEQGLITAATSAQAASKIIMTSARGNVSPHLTPERPAKVARPNPLDLLESERHLLEKRGQAAAAAAHRAEATNGGAGERNVQQADQEPLVTSSPPIAAPNMWNDDYLAYQQPAFGDATTLAVPIARSPGSSTEPSRYVSLRTVVEEAMDEGEEGGGGENGGTGMVMSRQEKEARRVHVDVSSASEAVDQSKRAETGQGDLHVAGVQKNSPAMVILNGGSFSQPFSLPQVTGLPKSPNSPAQTVASTMWSQPFFAPSDNRSFNISREADEVMPGHVNHHVIRTAPLTHASLFATIKQLKKGGDDDEPPLAL